MDDNTALEMAGPIAHNNVAVFSACSVEEMERVLSHEELRGLIWHRFDATRAFIDPTGVRQFHERLAALGITVSVAELPE